MYQTMNSSSAEFSRFGPEVYRTNITSRLPGAHLRALRIQHHETTKKRQ